MAAPGSGYPSHSKNLGCSSLTQDGSPNVKELAWQAARKLLEEHHFVCLRDTDELLIYEDGVYVPGGEAYIKSKVQDNAEVKDEISTHLVNEIIGHVKRSTLRPREIFDEGENPHLVLQNCLLNLKTMEQEDFRPDYYALNKMPVIYAPKKRCPKFQTFINEILSREDVQGVQEELGATLRKRYLTKKLSIYLGPTDTGKTSLINVILALLGKDNVSNISIQQLGARDRFGLAELFAKMANIRDDLSKDVIQTVGKLKELTGGFPVQAERKFKDPFSFVNRAYLFFTCNILPPVEEDDDAFFNRVVIRLFRNRFGGHERADRELLDKLTTPDELSGILNWALEGLKRLEENGWEFTNTSSLEVTREDYKRRSDPVWAFTQDRLEVDSAGAVTKEKLYNDFKAYCTEKGIPLLSKDVFFKTLPSKVMVESGQRQLPGETAKKHCFIGIKLLLNGEKSVPPVPPVPPGQTRLPKEQPEQPEHPSSQLSGGEKPPLTENAQRKTLLKFIAEKEPKLSVLEHFMKDNGIDRKIFSELMIEGKVVRGSDERYRVRNGVRYTDPDREGGST